MLERVLWINREGDAIVTYELNTYNALPVFKKLSEMEELLNLKEIETVEYNSMPMFDYDDISESSKQIIENRWNVIKSLVTCEPDIYISKRRGAMIEKVTEENSTIKKTIYKWLRKYWEDGKTKSALLPDIYKCGGMGKTKSVGIKKRGRPSKKISDIQINNETNSELNQGTISQDGINITDDIRDKISRGYKKFYANKQEMTYVQAYQRTLEGYFSKGNYKNQNGIIVPIIDLDNSPSLTQFKYWGKQSFSEIEMNKFRKGEIKHELYHRAVVGESTIESFGPGRRFQIDATIADIYLVNRLNKNYIIGRPVVYMVIDVFSRMIVGFYVGLEGPSWMGAMMALYNTTRNKIELCKEFGINIEEGEWDCCNLPDSITVDRGEMESTKPLNLIQNLGVRIDILPPYRADWKGIIEQNFRRLNNKTLHWLKGTVKKQYRVRGEEDYRLGALLDLEEFTKVIILSIIYFNGRYMNYYDKDEQMIRDDVLPIPKDLWRWGIANRTGLLKSYPEDVIKFNLMPSIECSITYRGLLFQKRRYSSEEAVNSGVFERARKSGNIKVKISFDPRNIDYIYVHEKGGFIKYSLVDNIKRNLYLEEVACAIEMEEKEAVDFSRTDIQNTAELNASIDMINEGANKKFKETQDSNNKRIKNIKSNRKEEKEFNREKEAWELEKESNDNKIGEATNINENVDEDEYLPAPQYLELLKFETDKDGNNGK
jgi:putative transposase